MKGINQMGKKQNKVILELTEVEYEYILELCSTMYKNLKKFPINMRTPKFYLLENIVKNSLKK